MDGRLERATERYQRAVFQGDPGGLAAASRELDAVEADLSMARGRVFHGRFLTGTGPAGASGTVEELAFFERAADLYRSLGDARGEGEALLWIGIYHQVVGRDQEAAVPVLERAAALARRDPGDPLTLSYALRHLGIAAHAAGDLDTARARLEESTQLRRDLDFRPGVAANLVGLAHLSAAQGRPDDVPAILAEAAELATEAGAHAILAQVAEARAELDTP
jgi:tetratricopeptide (TPR) repeat protein